MFSGDPRPFSGRTALCRCRAPLKGQVGSTESRTCKAAVAKRPQATARVSVLFIEILRCDGRGSKPCWEVISEPSLEFRVRVERWIGGLNARSAAYLSFVHYSYVSSSLAIIHALKGKLLQYRSSSGQVLPIVVASQVRGRALRPGASPIHPSRPRPSARVGAQGYGRHYAVDL